MTLIFIVEEKRLIQTAGVVAITIFRAAGTKTVLVENAAQEPNVCNEKITMK